MCKDFLKCNTNLIKFKGLNFKTQKLSKILVTYLLLYVNITMYFHSIQISDVNIFKSYYKIKHICLNIETSDISGYIILIIST